MSDDNKSESGSEGEEYIVEKILSKRTKAGVTEYLIKWQVRRVFCVFINVL
jgi:hypothetical protein